MKISTMTNSDIEKFRQQLLKLRTDTQALEIEFKASSEPVELDQTRVGRLSRMDAIQGQQMALDASRRRQKLLLMIDRALQNIESGDYGYCVDCGEDIDIRRLAIDPTNLRCIQCAQ